MFNRYYIILWFITIVINYSSAFRNGILMDNDPNNIGNEIKLNRNKISVEQDIVTIQVYYESHSTFSRNFISKSLQPVAETLSPYINIYGYPFGRAKIVVDEYGIIDVVCPHGHSECYGNKLHACTFDILGNVTEAVIFNSCLVDPALFYLGSDDGAAYKCGKILGVDSKPMKKCAKGNRGDVLLYHCWEETKKVHLENVPYVLVNGIESNGDLLQDVCNAFETKPLACGHL